MALSIQSGLRRFATPLAAALIGTPIEDAAYRTWHALARTGSGRNDYYDRLTLEVMSRVLRPGSNCIDVGAHRGSILKHMVKLAPGGRHSAVEPLPMFAKGLRRAFRNVEVHEMALSDRAGATTFRHVVTHPSYSGLSPRAYPTSGIAIRELVVQVTTLDDLVGPDRSIDFIKIDVEGGELGVIKGARGVLARYQPVVLFEHGRGGGERAVEESAEIWDEFGSAGMSVYKPDAWLLGGGGLEREEFTDEVRAGEYYFLAAR